MSPARRSPHRLVSNGGTAGAPALSVCAFSVLFLVAACHSAKRQGAEPVSSATSGGAAAHVADDCASAHSAVQRPPAPLATSLNAADRARLTSLRVSAHFGSVIIRKNGADWTISGPQGCVVSPARIERALNNLGSLHADSTDERLREGVDFELQLMALVEEERVLHFDIADRKDGRDLIQLGDSSTFRLQGLDRDLWSPDPSIWCRPD